MIGRVLAGVALACTGGAAAFVAAAGPAGAQEVISTSLGIGTSTSVRVSTPVTTTAATVAATVSASVSVPAPPPPPPPSQTTAPAPPPPPPAPSGSATVSSGSATVSASTPAAPAPSHSSGSPSSPSSAGSGPAGAPAGGAGAPVASAATAAPSSAPAGSDGGVSLVVSSHGRAAFLNSGRFGAGAVAAPQRGGGLGARGKHGARGAFALSGLAGHVAGTGIRSAAQFFTALTSPWLAPASGLGLGGRLVPPPAPRVDTGSTSWGRFVGGGFTWGLPIMPLIAAGALLFLLFMWFFARPGEELQASSGPLRTVAQNTHGAIALAAGATALICAVIVLLLALL